MELRRPEGLVISHTPVRKVIRRSSAVSNGTFRTYKHPDHDITHLPGESNNELLFLQFAEMDPNITAIVAQPTTLVAALDGRSIEHIPDYAVRFREADMFVEAKGSAAYSRPDLRRRLAACEEAAALAGWHYRTVLGGELIGSHFRTAVSSLWRCHRQTYSQLQLTAVTNLLRQGDFAIDKVVATLERCASLSAPNVRQVLSMAAGNRIFIVLEPNTEVGRHSVVRHADPEALPDSVIPFRQPSMDIEGFA